MKIGVSIRYMEVTWLLPAFNETYPYSIKVGDVVKLDGAGINYGEKVVSLSGIMLGYYDGDNKPGWIRIKSPTKNFWKLL